MVSLFNNEGMRLRYTQNETMIQFPNYLYDPYAYPSNLSLMDYHWNLFYPQNHYAIQTKRKKKLKEQLANERIFKEMMPSFEYKKSELIEWLKSLTLTERFKVFSIQDDWLTAALIKMYKKWADCDDIVFALLSDSKKSGDSKSSLQFDDLENYFFCRKRPSIEAPPLEKQELIEKGEKELIENLRIYDSNEVYDTIMLDERFVEDIDNIVKLFELISEGFAFSKPCKLAYDHSTKTVVWDSPLWFSSNSFQTFPAWIVSSLERAVWIQYFNEKKNVVRNSMLAAGAYTQISLKYKEDLTDFWKTLDKNKKKKMLSSAVETYKSMSNDKSKTDSKDCKDISQKLKLLFNAIYGSNKSDLPSYDKVSEYFQGLSIEPEDEVTITKILFTSLDDFGTVTNLICRKLTHKLKTMLSEKIATDLIMNEEKEKSNNNKKNTKKRKLAKGASKNISSPAHNTSDEQPEAKDTIKSEEKHEDDIKHCNIPLKDDRKNSSGIEDKVDNTELDPTIGSSSLEIIPSCSSVNCEIWEYAKSIVNKIVARTILGSPTSDFANHHEFDLYKVKQSHHKATDDAHLDRKLSLDTQTSVTSKACEHAEEVRVRLSPSQKKPLAKEERSAGKRLKNVVEVNVDHKDRTPDNSKHYEEEKQQKESDSSVCSTIETKNSASEEGEVHERVQIPTKFSTKTDEGKRVKEEPRYFEKASDARKNLKKEFENEGGFRSRGQTKQVDSQKYITSSTCRTEIDTTDSESGLLLKGKGSSAPQEKSHGDTQRVNRVQDNEVKDSFGFIEVKPKKKKSVKPVRTKKEPKDGFRKKKEKTSTAPGTTVEGQTSEKVKGPGTSKSTSKAATSNNELKKPVEDNNAKKTVAATPVQTAAVATVQTQAKVVTPKAVAQNKPALVVSCGPQVLTKQSSTGSGPDSATGVQGPSAPKMTSSGRKTLSLTSPSLDLGALQTNRVKGIAKEYFEKKFTKDIFDHVSVLTEKSNKMMQSRILVYKRLDLCIAKIFPMYNMKTKIFGSCATGLALTTSDVDIAVSGIETYDRSMLCDSLLQISESLKNFKWLVSFKPILTAHVPVLKLEIDPRISFGDVVDSNAASDMKVKTILNSQTPDLNLPCDLDEDIKIKVDLTLESLGMMGYSIHMGYKSTEFAEKMLEKYDSLYIVTMALKEFLFNRKLLNTYQGGVSSYCLILMIVTIMKKYGDEGYMASLRRFFKVYGESFHPETTGISLAEADPFFPLNHSYETAPLWIIDHNNFMEKRNIGQGAYLVKGILHEFEKATKIIDFLQQKFEEMVLQHKSKVKTIEDIGLVDDPELKKFMSTSILESFI